MAIAFFSTWTTYGTWLPGDWRGFRQHGRPEKGAIARWEFEARFRMTGTAVLLNQVQRNIVEETVANHCVHRAWELHAVSCRSNHVHAILTAPDRDLKIPREQFMAWCTRKLKEHERTVSGFQTVRECWWTERGWDEYLDTDEDFDHAMEYVLEGQDFGFC